MGTQQKSLQQTRLVSMAATEIKLFNKYSFEDVAVQDIALKDYVACKPAHAVFLPHSAGRWAKKRCCDIIHLTTGENPIQVIVDAVVNSGAREDSCRIGSAGVVRRQAIDVSPLRRVNTAIHLLTTGARDSAFRNIKTIAECLAEEFQNAAKGSSNSCAIKKKDEIERVAKANR